MTWIDTTKWNGKRLHSWMQTASLPDIFAASILDARIDQINFDSFCAASRKIGRTIALESAIPDESIVAPPFDMFKEGYIPISFSFKKYIVKIIKAFFKGR